ncbi:MAG: DNA polymerase III subunit chi [Arenicella sp.]|nr:DNA polymerase III subunit chi [Arenicella sp.]
MKQVDFYLISNRINDAKYKLASRLANKLQRLKQSCLIVTDNTEATTELDRVMWSFSDSSFLAHDLTSESKPLSSIQIGDHNSITARVLEREHDVLINLSSDIPIFNHNFSRIAEIVEADDDAKASARTRYKSYQGQGFELKMHNIEL